MTVIFVLLGIIIGLLIALTLFVLRIRYEALFERGLGKVDQIIPKGKAYMAGFSDEEQAVADHYKQKKDIKIT